MKTMSEKKIRIFANFELFAASAEGNMYRDLSSSSVIQTEQWRPSHRKDEYLCFNKALSNIIICRAT